MDEAIINITSYHCFTVQHFAYKASRSRNKSGIPFGPTNTTLMEFTLKLLNPADSKLFYERLVSNNTYACTFLFNATFNEMKRLKAFDDAMVVEGYIVDLEDNYDATPDEDGTSEQILLNIKILVHSITYKGRVHHNDKVLRIKQS